MTRPTWRRRRLSAAASLAVWGALALLVALDRPSAPDVVALGLFGWLLSGLQAIWGVLSGAGVFLATSAEAAVLWLAQSVAWLSIQFGNLLVSTGAIFAKTWDALRVLWTRALRPFFVYVDDWIRRIHGWLDRIFGPVYDWLRRVRDYIDRIYKRFIQPILDTIEFLRLLNRTLQVFHIRVLEGLDRVLADLEDRLERPILWLHEQLARVSNWIDRIVTADGFFQRYMLMRSMWRYRVDTMAQWWTHAVRPLTDDELAELRKGPEPKTPAEHIEEVRAAVVDGAGPLAAKAREFIADIRIKQAALKGS